MIVLCLAGPGSASAAVQVGETFPPSSACNNFLYTFFQIESPGNVYAAPNDGVLTAWKFEAGPTPPTLKLKVVRPLPSGDFLIVGETSVRFPLPNQLNTLPIQISVRAGDLLGYKFVSDGECTESVGPPGYAYSRLDGDPPPGTTAPASGAPFPGRLDLAATLEPDCDSDGLGDESQDVDIVSCDGSPPDTAITKGPKEKTKHKQATFEFAGTDTRDVAGFQCSLDGAAFAPCSSPHTVKVKKGKHTFSVRAIDANGNVDATPATDHWRVKKKRRK